MINIKRSPKPEKEINYKDIDIRKKIHKDFYHLCYLCENEAFTSYEIDHFYPQNEFKLKINDWDNLFLICSDCNKIRPKKINVKGKEVLNSCCDDVENLIQLRFIYNLENEPESIGIKSSLRNKKVKNTIKLLKKIYILENSLSRRDIFLFYHKINNRVQQFKNKLEIYVKIKKNCRRKKNLKLEIIDFLRKDTIFKKTGRDDNTLGFISFKRQIIKDNPAYKKFEKYFD